MSEQDHICRVPITKGQFLCFRDYASSPEGCEDVWFEDKDGNEMLYYHYEEWQEDPKLVMGCIMAAIQGGAKTEEEIQKFHKK